ncbi:SGNH/GDSL hydrolase family protein [Actinomadura violacea]|uniref:SGNH/GDSL hydrolase family protein n=1 Tax=Actinomadura violacea TaxID=2819934 RepID=A0ABS3RQ74_9ACTN|nr:SGNH/GDSL hydrolase family protein [Actinomadura violacea]MBO2458894.1 SGNH/GDSL hydrolase family protein [Actinomadura violacea]
MTSRRARRGAATLLLCLGLLGVPLLAGCGGTAGPGNREARADAPAPKAAPQKAGPQKGPQNAAQRASVVFFLGDSYTVGDRGVQPETTYASATGRLMGWQVVVEGRAGTGFVKTVGGEAFLQLFESQLGWRPAPDLLIVSGGHNDWRVPPPRVAAAARTLLERARQRWPGTHIVLMGPLWGNDTPPPNELGVRNALRNLATQMAVPFIDPLAERWITGNRLTHRGNAPQYIKRDGTHPDEAGHRYVATRLAADVKRLGLAHPLRKSA